MNTKVGVTAAAFLPRNAMYSADCAVACMMLAGYSMDELYCKMKMKMTQDVHVSHETAKHITKHFSPF